MRVKGRDKGLSLLELVIAVFVLALGSMAALRATDQARISIGGASERTFAQLAVDNRAEALKLLGRGAGLPDRVALGGQEFTLETLYEATVGGVLRTTITARGQGGAGAVITVYLPPRP